MKTQIGIILAMTLISCAPERPKIDPTLPTQQFTRSQEYLLKGVISSRSRSKPPSIRKRTFRIDCVEADGLAPPSKRIGPAWEAAQEAMGQIESGTIGDGYRRSFAESAANRAIVETHQCQAISQADELVSSDSSSILLFMLENRLLPK